MLSSIVSKHTDTRRCMYKVQRGMKFVKDKSDLLVNVRKKKSWLFISIKYIWGSTNLAHAYIMVGHICQCVFLERGLWPGRCTRQPRSRSEISNGATERSKNLVQRPADLGGRLVGALERSGYSYVRVCPHKWLYYSFIIL